MLIGFATLYGLFWIRVLGAGDVKLFCAIGAFMGKEVDLTFDAGENAKVVKVTPQAEADKKCGMCFYIPAYLQVDWQLESWRLYWRNEEKCRFCQKQNGRRVCGCTCRYQFCLAILRM